MLCRLGRADVDRASRDDATDVGRVVGPDRRIVASRLVVGVAVRLEVVVRRLADRRRLSGNENGVHGDAVAAVYTGWHDVSVSSATVGSVVVTT